MFPLCGVVLWAVQSSRSLDGKQFHSHNNNASGFKQANSSLRRDDRAEMMNPSLFSASVVLTESEARSLSYSFITN